MEEAEPKPKRARHHQDKFSAFERDLIRAARDKLTVTFEMIDMEDEISAQVIQVDTDFIKFEIAGERSWFNKEMICNLRINEMTAA